MNEIIMAASAKRSNTEVIAKETTTETIISKETNTEVIAKETIPKETIPKETIPKETAPRRMILVDSLAELDSLSPMQASPDVLYHSKVPAQVVGCRRHWSLERGLEHRSSRVNTRAIRHSFKRTRVYNYPYPFLG
jgi:hypothetical protein